MGWAIVKAADQKQFWNSVSLGVKDLEIMLRSFLFLPIMNILLFIKSWTKNQSIKEEGLFKQNISPQICT
tara:strand:- start:259 stop:468 length:210 start_codon:yes stop_codon:yes gene_type:complete